jgi:flagellar basal-body rod protein FlgG
MLESLYIGATGLHAQQLYVDTIANNLANVNTPGFKKSRVDFQDLMYRELSKTTSPSGTRDASQRAGSGVGVVNAEKIFIAGDVRKTDAPLDIAIQGDGFIEVVLPDGSYAYSRGGSLQINRDGLLATAEGYSLRASMHVPSDARQMSISADGRMLVTTAANKAPSELGQIELAKFANPGGLKPLGNNLYRVSESSGDPVYGKAASEGFGALSQGFLELSNVRLNDEMVNLMVAQRAYEVNTRLIQVSDELMSMSNNLRRG